jgi:hypothetical protein
MTDPTPVDPLEGINLDDLPDDQRIAAATLVELRAERTAIMEERRGRRLSFRVMAVGGVIALLALSGFVLDWRADKARYSQVTCSERISRAEQIRGAIVTGVDAVAEYLDAEDAERAEVERIVDDAVRRELPPPDC